MLAQRTSSALVRRGPASRRMMQSRLYHVENRVNNNFPFRYEGESKTRFTVGFLTVAAVGFSAPFLACAFQL
ncbi:hypothetical protein JCM10908_007285 [Rhodotorula pacifica]|uniref:cytochrome c oxidase subunit VIII n=1 Tax=Rhodotorula pacifica TaxID=1495444 RepID=UPI00316BBA0C